MYHPITSVVEYFLMMGVRHTTISTQDVALIKKTDRIAVVVESGTKSVTLREERDDAQRKAVKEVAETYAQLVCKKKHKAN